MSIHDLSGISLYCSVINHITPTQALFVYPKPLSPSEKNLIVNMHKSPKFILAQTRNIQFEVKMYGHFPGTKPA